VFSGGALKSFPAFLRATLDGDLAARERIAGVFSRENVTRTAGTIGEELPLDVPIPLDYDDFLASLDERLPGEQIAPVLLFETSRGCWWGQRAHCTFCGLNGQSMNYRAMSPDNAVPLIQSLFKYASRVARLQCVDNIMPKNYPKEVFARLNTPPQMRIFYEVKADLTEEDLQLLADARVREVQPGIEAMATSTLKLMRKGTNVFQNLRFLANCATREIFPCWNLLIGFPGERADVYQKYVADIPHLVHLPPPSGAYPVRPDRYSPYHVRAAEFGLQLRPSDFYALVYPFPEASLENLAYFFRDHNFRAEHFTAMVEWFNPLREKVEMWRSRWDPQKHALPPMLYLEERADGAVVYDSRSRETVEHAIDAAGLAVLKHLGRPRVPRDVPRAIAEHAEADVTRALEALESAGLIFREGDHVMSLVFPAKPSWKEAIDGWSWAA
jgi:ribosomal peptide maturation radical SAM protein 1